jgi:hypothetical protein
MLLIPILVMASQVLGPSLPAGTNPSLHHLVVRVEELLEAGDFQAASKLAPLLPQRALNMQWDDAKVSIDQRDEFNTAKTDVIRLIGNVLKDFQFNFVSSKPDIKITFVESIPPDSPDGPNRGAAFIFSENPLEPRLEAVIALSRGKPLQPSSAADVKSDFQYAIGAYYGLSTSRLAHLMNRSDLPLTAASAPSLADLNLIKQAVVVSDVLRTAIAKQQRLTPARPAAKLDPLAVELKGALQGDPTGFSIQVSNTGNAPLLVRTQPDCGCVATTPFMELKPGDSALIKGLVDTTDVVGTLNKHIVVFTNDPEMPVREIPITLPVTSRFRFIAPAGEVFVVPDGNPSYEVFLTFNGINFNLTEPHIDGLPGTVQIEPWKGVLADPLAGQGAMERSGYRLRISLKDGLPPGRSTATFLATTDDPRFPVIRYPFSVQKGIVALPDQVYFGEIARAPTRATFLVSRPGAPFEITSVESDNKSLAVTVPLGTPAEEHRVTVAFDGKAPSGKLDGTIRIHTSDPKQKTILVPVQAYIR